MTVNDMLNHLMGIDKTPSMDEHLYLVEIGWTNSKEEMFMEKYLFRHDSIPSEILNSKVEYFCMECYDNKMFTSLKNTEIYDKYKSLFDFYFDKLKTLYYLYIDVKSVLDIDEE